MAIWISIMIEIILVLNLLVYVYGETGFWFASTKIFTITGLTFFSFFLFCGGIQGQQIRDFHYWNNLGAIYKYLVGGVGGKIYQLCSRSYRRSDASRPLVGDVDCLGRRDAIASSQSSKYGKKVHLENPDLVYWWYLVNWSNLPR
ncbi:hypothetical protein N7462_008215 [Penicillium macrosclerotiorum]|uniref:uncharacterized protein n=1 Tax=Penicillium macrosclerotiorum TaxID=303699 RepID=UPI002546902C|nr:uncharacterized protein N7462_008215 [Penicillium macrosclerotiorum]KAJ5679971.1 hypothetical protein N7462_008215 [Penicillium macrosclerotiorum]